MQCTNATIVSKYLTQKSNYSNMLRFTQILKETRKLWKGKKRAVKKNRVKVRIYQIQEWI